MRKFAHRVFTGIRLISDAGGLILSHPIFVAPLLFCWATYTLLGFYLAYLHPWAAMGPAARLLTGLGAAFVVTLTLTAANHISLELIQQLERDRPPSISRAIWDTLRWNLLQSLLIIMIWTPLWFLFTIVDLALGGDEDGGQADEVMIGTAASVLMGNIRNFSFSRAFLRALVKTMRMAVFLILPAIAWEHRGAVQGARRGLDALRSHMAEFSAGLVTSELVASAVFLPLILFFSLAERLEFSLPGNGLPIAILYFTLAWSLVFYVEQVFAALLYLWHSKWEAVRESTPDPDSSPARLQDVPMPLLLDGIPKFAG